MIRIGIVGNIGSGKSFVAKSFGYPVFNADKEVSIIYKKDKKIFLKLKKNLPNFFLSFPVDKKDVGRAILSDNKNLGRIVKILHAEVRKRMNSFLKKNKNKKLVILDIPLLLENKIHTKKDIIIFVEAKKSEILKRLNKRKNFNKKLFKKFQKIQYPAIYKKKKSNFIIKNDFKKNTIKKCVNNILVKILR